MAIIHTAVLTPSKLDLVSDWLLSQPWAEKGASPTQIGSYRFDDPAGEVGIEFLLVGSGETIYHVPFSYRGSELPGAEKSLVGTMEHSTLGTRYVYDALADPVAIQALVRAVLTGGQQAELEVEDTDGAFETRPPLVIAKGSGRLTPPQVPVINTVDTISRERDDALAVISAGGVRISVARVLGGAKIGTPETLLVSWLDGQAVLAGVAPL